MSVIQKAIFYCLVFYCPWLFAQSTLEEKVDAYLAPLVQAGDFYGRVLFAKNGYIELTKGYGYANLSHKVPNRPETIYHIGSVNKPITAVGVMPLHQAGFV